MREFLFKNTKGYQLFWFAFVSGFLFVSSIIFLPGIMFAQVSIEQIEEPVLLNGEWKIRLYQDYKSFSELEEDTTTEWHTIRMPGSVISFAKELMGREHHKGFAHLRMEVLLEEEVNEQPLGLLMGSLSMADKTYWNGEFIGGAGQFPPDFFNGWKEPRYYYISPNSTHFNGTNQLDIFFYYNTFGFIDGNIEFGNYEDLEPNYEWNSFFRKEIHIILIIMLLSFGLYFLIIFFMRPQQKESLFFFLLALSQTFSSENYFLKYLPGHYLWQEKISFSSTYLVMGFFVLFVQDYFKVSDYTKSNVAKQFHRIMRYLPIGAALFITLVFLFMPTLNRIKDINNYTVVFNLIPLVYIVYIVLVNAIKRDRYAIFLSLSLLMLVLFAVHDMFMIIQEDRPAGIYLTPLGAPLIVLSVALSLGHRIFYVYIKLDESQKQLLRRNELIKQMNEGLEQTVQERTLQLKESNESLKDKMEQMKKELNVAKLVQESILPHSGIETPYLLSAFVFRPMTEMSGDFYDQYQKPDGRIGFLIADVSGHGVPSALIMSMAKTVFTEAWHSGSNSAEICQIVNSRLTPTLQESGFFLTALLIIIDPTTLMMDFTNAGHHPILIVSTPEKYYHFVEGDDVIIGIDENYEFSHSKHQLSIGDRIYLYTDGIVESRNPQNEEFEEERLADTLLESIQYSLKDSMEYLLKKLDEFCENIEQRDDRTLLAIEIIDLLKKQEDQDFSKEENQTESGDNIIDEDEERLRLAKTMVSQGDFLKAKDYLKEILDNDPQYTPAISLLGMVEQKTNNLPEAEKQYKRAEEISPYYVPNLYRLGVLYIQMEKYDDALEIFKQINSINPAFRKVKYYLHMLEN